MAGTFSQMYIQAVFAVKYRQALIRPLWEEQFYRYTTGIIRNNNQKLLAINGMPDHIHILVGIKPACCLSDLVREVKKSTNEFINESGFTKSRFQWQGGFGAFSYSHSHLDNVIRYIMNQKEHHRRKTFKDEYLSFLKKFEVPYEEQYLFDWLE